MAERRSQRGQPNLGGRPKGLRATYINLDLHDNERRWKWKRSKLLASFKDEVELKDYSLDLKLNVHRCIGQFRRLPSPPRKTRLRRYFVQKWRSCEGNAYAHARRKDKDVPLNICRLKNGKASHTVVSQK